MKKIFLFCSIIVCCFSAKAQTLSLTTTATTVSSGYVINIKVVGETHTKEAQSYIYDGLSSVPFNGGAKGSIVGTGNFYGNSVNGTPSDFAFLVTNTSSVPLTVTYNFRIVPVDGTTSTPLSPVAASVTVVVNPAPPQPVPAPNEGDFVRNDDNGQVFWFFEGKIRYIPNQDVLHGLFNGYTDASAKHYTTAQLNLASVQTGVPINPDNGLINDTNTGRIYFREANLVRWVRSADAMNRYHFSWNSVKNRAGIAGYTVGADIN
jgi:hypothetical protein